MGCVYVRGTAQEPAILRFRVEGMKHLDADDLKDRLATHESDRSLPVPIAGPVLHQIAGLSDKVHVSKVDPDQLAVDRQRVEAYCRDHGYYDARVTDAQVVPVGPGQVDVVMRVDEGEPIRVGRVEVAGLDATPEAKAAMGSLPLAEGDVFTVAAYDAARARVVAALRNNGWANARVTQEANVLPEEHRAEVRYAVDPGARFRFGPIFVAGTGAVPRDRVREQAGLELKSGDWYAEDKLVKAQGRVFEMGVFGGVRVTRGTPDEQRGTIPVVVAVREAPFRTIRAGPSVGIQSSSRVDLAGNVGWTDRNFHGDLRRLDLGLRAGYAWLNTPRKAGPAALGTAELSQPGALARNVDASVRLELERGLEQAYDFWSERVRLSAPIHAQRRWTLVPSYNVEVYQLFNVPPGTQIDPNNPVTGNSPVLAGCTFNAHPICLLSYLEQRIAWDGRDNPVNTTRGVYGLLSVQEGFNLGSFGYRYLRFQPEVRGYLPLGNRAVLAARSQVGALVPLGESGLPPLVARFYAGGPNSMRGYSLNRLSPMLLNKSGDWVAVGGNGLAEASLELRVRLSGNLVGAVFTDAGYVSPPSALPNAYRDALDPSNLQWAAGFGIRYVTPLGPLRLDLAGRLPTDGSSGVSFQHRFPFIPRYDPTIAATHREPILAFHLTIGEAF